jgi:coenzyme F420-reducing hydrogenase delta subunit
MKKTAAIPNSRTALFAAVFCLLAETAALLISCASAPPKTTSQLKLNFTLPLQNPHSEKIAGFLAESTSLLPDKIPDAPSALLYPSMIVMGRGIAVTDTSVLYPDSRFGKLIPPWTFPNPSSSISRPATSSWRSVSCRVPTHCSPSISGWKKPGTAINFQTPAGQAKDIETARNQFHSVLANCSRVKVSTLSGNSLVAQGARRFTPTAADGAPPFDLVWEGVCSAPVFYVAAYQGKDDGTGNLDIPPASVKAVRRNYQFVLIFPPDEAALASWIRSERLYPDGYSIVDGRDKEGYFKTGYDREGYDRFGWSSRTRYAGKFRTCFPTRPARGRSESRRRDHRARRRTALERAFAEPRRIIPRSWRCRKIADPLAAGNRSGTACGDSPQARHPEKGYLGFSYDNIEWGSADAVNKKGETWSGSARGGRQGFGVHTRTDGSRFIGTFRDDAAEGVCMEIFSSGDIEVQEWRRGERVASWPASGRIVSPAQGWVYVGTQAADGFAHGRGDAIAVDGSRRIEGGRFDRAGSSKVPWSKATGRGWSAPSRTASSSPAPSPGPTAAATKVLSRTACPKAAERSRPPTRLPTSAVSARASTRSWRHPAAQRREIRREFKAGKPHGTGIYFNGTAVERCEYYEGQRIDQAYLIRVENEKQLEALRIERERIAKEKADQAEQQRIAAERAAAAQKASSERSSNNLIAGLFGVGTALAGGSIGLNAVDSVRLGAAAATDVAKGDAAMSGTKATGQSIAQSRGIAAQPQGGAAAGPSGGSGRTAAKKKNPILSLSTARPTTRSPRR